MIRRIFYKFRKQIWPRAYRTLARNQLNMDWVVECDQPWIVFLQLPRSGGTMMLRYLDSHPHCHVRPTPTANGLRTKAWDYTLYNQVGFHKGASNIEQPTIPIYFDTRWFRQLKEAAYSDTTAFFNSWRNYQKLYGPKKWIVVHHALAPGQNYEEWYAKYLAHRHAVVFTLVRDPSSWERSMLQLIKGVDPKTQDRGFLLDEWYKSFLSQVKTSAFIDFNEAKKIFGYPYVYPQTVNGIPVPPNTIYRNSTQAGKQIEVTDDCRVLDTAFRRLSVQNPDNLHRLVDMLDICPV